MQVAIIWIRKKNTLSESMLIKIHDSIYVHVLSDYDDLTL